MVVFEADGGLRSCCVNAVSGALAEATVPVGDLVVACSACLLGPTVVLDPNASELSKAGHAELSVACALHSGLVAACALEGKIVPEDLDDATEAAAAGCEEVGKFLRACLLRRMAQIGACSDGL